VDKTPLKVMIWTSQCASGIVHIRKSETFIERETKKIIYLMFPAFLKFRFPGVKCHYLSPFKFKV